MNDKVKMLLARLEEPSTWAGGGIGMVLIAQFIPGPTGTALDAFLAALFALVAIVLPENGSK